jgi:protein tyrosine/serine phosphatase
MGIYMTIPMFRLLALFFIILIPVQTSLGFQNIPNSTQVETWLYRGGQPSKEGLKELLSWRIKTIINLESEWFQREPDVVRQEHQFAIRNNIQFNHIPMHPFLSPKKQDIQAVLVIMRNPANHPIFIHCRRGVDRTGLVIAAYRIQYQGWKAERAYEEMKRYGHRHHLLFWWKTLLFQSEQSVLKSNLNYFQLPLGSKI